MARRLSLKQKLHFGTKRQRTAAKQALGRKRPKRRHAARSAPPRRSKPVIRRKKNAARRRHNPGEIISLMYPLGNPATRSKRVAKTKRHNRARRHTAGRANPKRRRNPPTVRHHRRRHNPGQMGGTLTMALGVTAGALGSKIGAQVVLGAKNTGFMGYAGNAAAGGLLAWGAHAFLRKPIVTQSILVGTAVQILLRVIGDYSLIGSYSAQIGVGDYMVSNWVAPQRLPDAFHSANVEIPSGWGPSQVMASSGVQAQSLGLDASRG